MKPGTNLLKSFFLIALIVTSDGCMNQEARKAAVIKGMIKGGLPARSTVMNASEGMFADYKVYQDGDQDGVVFEYVIVANAVIDRSELTPESVKQILREGLATNKDAKRALQMGIYARMIYTSFDGETLCDAKITADDL